MIDTLMGMGIGIVVFVAGMLTQRMLNQPDRKPLFKPMGWKASSTAPLIEYDPYDDAMQPPNLKGRSTVE